MTAMLQGSTWETIKARVINKQGMMVHYGEDLDLSVSVSHSLSSRLMNLRSHRLVERKLSWMGVAQVL